MSKSTKQNRRTRKEREAIVEAWSASGLSAEVFARDKEFSASSLYSWKKNLGGGSGRTDETKSDFRFVPVVVDDDAGASGALGWRLETRAGIALSMSGPGAMEGLAFVLRELGERGAL